MGTGSGKTRFHQERNPEVTEKIGAETVRMKGTERDVVRACARANLGGILEILAEAPEAATWNLSGIEGILERHGRYFLVAQRGEVTAGFVAGRGLADEGEILNLAVKKQYRRQGTGRALVRELMQILGREGVKQVYLEVRESNTGAIAFYQGLGFEPAGRRAGYYRDPDEAALLLRVNLPESSVEGLAPRKPRV